MKTIILLLTLFCFAGCMSKKIELVFENYNPSSPVIVVSKGKCGFFQFDTIVKLKDGNGKLITVIDNSLQSVIPGDVIK